MEGTVEGTILSGVCDGDRNLFQDDEEHCHNGIAFGRRCSYNAACIFQWIGSFGI